MFFLIQFGNQLRSRDGASNNRPRKVTFSNKTLTNLDLSNPPSSAHAPHREEEKEQTLPDPHSQTDAAQLT